MWENLLVCVNFFFFFNFFLFLWSWQNFVGMFMDIFMGIGKFCGYCENILLGMWEFICAWSCGNFFLACRDFLFAWLWKNLVVVWICDKFGSGDILVGYWFDFVVGCWFDFVMGYWLQKYFLGMEIFWLHILGYGNWWVEFLCCRPLRVEGVSKCWKVHGQHCLLASKMSSMKRALAPFSKLCRIMRHMSTRIFSYFLP